MATTQRATSNRFRKTFGEPTGRAATKVKPSLTPFVQEFIRHSPFAVMATSDAQGNCDASPKGGKPGFIQVLDDRRLLLPDVAGNRLFQSYANMDANPHVGLVFFIPGITDTVRVNGRVQFLSKQELEQQNVEVCIYDPDDRGLYLQGIVIEVEEAYGHCPRALTFSRLWDVETIAAHQANRPIADRSTNV
ncbi:MAG: pyridoxamine 5'-phosphate oxidase family protein [SAR202 cluster bacterium]|nr:pyridoxamine 5'-phosphate oxidase family protein [SAR202 cluster bacterium]